MIYSTKHGDGKTKLVTNQLKRARYFIIGISINQQINVRDEMQFNK